MHKIGLVPKRQSVRWRKPATRGGALRALFSAPLVYAWGLPDEFVKPDTRCA